MAKNVKQSYFSLCLQNRPLKYCLEVYILPSPQNCSGNRGPEGKIPKGAKGLRKDHSDIQVISKTMLHLMYHASRGIPIY